jgi:hypothetical protein
VVRVAHCLERTRDGFDVASCEAAAQLACETKVDELMLEPVCSAGRAGTMPICEMP